MTALFATHTHPFPGREKEALGLAVESAEFYRKLAAEGKCTQPEQFISNATGKAYWFVKGKRDELLAMMDSADAKRLHAKCMLCSRTTPRSWSWPTRRSRRSCSRPSPVFCQRAEFDERTVRCWPGTGHPTSSVASGQVSQSGSPARKESHMVQPLAIVGRLVVVVTICAGLVLAAASAASAERWGYDDRRGDAPLGVDVLSTRLDDNVSGRYRIRVQGRGFIEDRTDMVRVYLDTRRANAGPEYRLSWYLGKNPAERKGATFLARIDNWGSPPIKVVRCPAIRKNVAFGKDLITLSVPKRCVKRPARVRWAGFVVRVTGVPNDHTYRGRHDYFPKYRSFKRQWVA